MKMGIAAGIVLSLVLLFPTLLPPSTWTYSLPPSIPIETVTPIPPAEPPPAPVERRLLPDFTVTPSARTEVSLISKGYLRYQMAKYTSWRPHVEWGTYQKDDGTWGTNDEFFNLLWDIILCESGAEHGDFVRTDKIGDLDIGYRSIGVFQINATVWPELADHYNLFDPAENAQAAYIIWKTQGLEAWSCYER